MINKLDPLDFKRNSRKRLTTKIDRVFEDLQLLEVVSPKEINKRMTLTFDELHTKREKIRKQDLNPANFKANHKYQQTKDKINKYVDMKYKKNPFKDKKSVIGILQDSSYIKKFDLSQKILYSSVDQNRDLIKGDKRKFGQSWDGTNKIEVTDKLPEIIQSKGKGQESPRSVRLSKLITKMMVDNLGIRMKEQSEPCSPKGKFIGGAKFKSEPVSPKNEFGKGENWVQTGKTQSKIRHAEINSSMDHAIGAFHTNSDEIFFDDEKIFAPGYIKYISDVDNSLTIQKYISQLSEKQRKNKKMLSKYSMV